MDKYNDRQKTQKRQKGNNRKNNNRQWWNGHITQQTHNVDTVLYSDWFEVTKSVD